MTRTGGRGANRGRGRGRDDFGKQGYPKFSANQGAPIIPRNLRGAPVPPDWRGRGRGGVLGGGAPPRGGGAPRQGRPGLNFTPTPSMLGIAPQSCWSCGDPSHRVGQDACFYKASALQQTKCGGCHMGGHRRQECAGPNQRAIQALREHGKADKAQMWQAGRGRALPQLLQQEAEEPVEADYTLAVKFRRSVMILGLRTSTRILLKST